MLCDDAILQEEAHWMVQRMKFDSNFGIEAVNYVFL